MKVFDKDSLSSDEALGEATLRMKQYTDGREHDLDLQLQGSKAEASFQLRVQYLPLSGGL